MDKHTFRFTIFSDNWNQSSPHSECQTSPSMITVSYKM